MNFLNNLNKIFKPKQEKKSVKKIENTELEEKKSTPENTAQIAQSKQKKIDLESPVTEKKFTGELPDFSSQENIENFKKEVFGELNESMTTPEDQKKALKVLIELRKKHPGVLLKFNGAIGFSQFGQPEQYLFTVYDSIEEYKDRCTASSLTVDEFTVEKLESKFIKSE